MCETMMVAANKKQVGHLREVSHVTRTQRWEVIKHKYFVVVFSRFFRYQVSLLTFVQISVLCTSIFAKLPTNVLFY